MNKTVLKRVVVTGITAVLATALFTGQTFAAHHNSSHKKKSNDDHVVRWEKVKHAESYNIYYTVSGKKKWLYSVPDVSGDQTAYKIRRLINDTKYKFEVRAVNADGAEFRTVKSGSFETKS